MHLILGGGVVFLEREYCLLCFCFGFCFVVVAFKSAPKGPQKEEKETSCKAQLAELHF